MNKNIPLYILIKCRHLLNFLPRIRLFAKLKKKINLKILFKKDKALWRVETAREMGATVGENCRFYSLGFFSEPYLVEIGSNVIISGKVKFLTHDGSYYLFKSRNDGCVYGKIKIGNNCFIGLSVIITPNTTIGDNCIIGAGAVIRGKIPDNSVVIGNPGKIMYKTPIIKKLLLSSKGQVTHPWGDEQLRKKIIINHFNNLPQ